MQYNANTRLVVCTAYHRCDNLFQQLESRTLTAEEEAVIQQRVAFQRKMFEEYEKREQKRKVCRWALRSRQHASTQVEELQGMMPELTNEEAAAALELCNGNEDDAAAQLTSDPSFLRHVRATLHGASMPAERPRSSAAPVGPRPKRVDLSKLGDGVFVGSFRGKGYENHQPHRRPAKPQREAEDAEEAEEAEDTEEAAEAEAEEDTPQQEAMQAAQHQANEESAEQAATQDDAAPEEVSHGSTDALKGSQKGSRASRGEDPEATATAILAQVREARIAVSAWLTTPPQRTPKALASLRGLEEAQRELVLRHAMDRAPQRGAALVAALFDSLEGGEEANDDDSSDFEVAPTRGGRRRASGALQAERQGGEGRQTRSKTPVSREAEVGRGKENEPLGEPTPAEGRTARVATASPAAAKAPVEVGGMGWYGVLLCTFMPVACTSTGMHVCFQVAAVETLARTGSGKGTQAIPRTGHTNCGRVRQKSSKSAELVEIGKLMCVCCSVDDVHVQAMSFLCPFNSPPVPGTGGLTAATSSRLASCRASSSAAASTSTSSACTSAASSGRGESFGPSPPFRWWRWTDPTSR